MADGGGHRRHRYSSSKPPTKKHQSSPPQELEDAAEEEDWKVGDKVEVVAGSDMCGRSWFPATVVEVMVDQHSCVVQYDHEDGATDTVHWQEMNRRRAKEEEEEPAVKVEHDEERHYRPPARSFFFEAGDKVELWSWHHDYGYSWFPATVENAVDPETYVVQKESLVEGKLLLHKELEELDFKYMRPAPAVVVEYPPSEFRPRTKVEAYCGGVWTPGVVRRAVGELEYEVRVGSKKIDNNNNKPPFRVIKVLTELRPRYKWDWNSMLWIVATPPPSKAKLQRQSVLVKRPSSSVEKASGDSEHSYGPESSAAKKSRKEPQQLELIPDGSEHASVSNTDNVSENTSYGYDVRTKVTTRRHKLKLHIMKRPKEECGPDSSLDATKMQLSTLCITHGSLLGKGQSATINSSCEANRNEGMLTDETATQVPFVKRLLPVWSTIEEMEVFKKVPQQPHFGPLEGKMCGLREGMALCLMGSFANVVESIRESSIEDSDESFEEMNNILSLLKDNGFNVQKLQACLNRLILTKSEYAKHLEEKDAIQAQKLLKGTCCSRVNSLLAEKMKAVVELEEKLGHLRQEVRQLAEEKEHGDNELSILEEAESMVNKACYDVEKQFGNALAEHLG